MLNSVISLFMRIALAIMIALVIGSVILSMSKMKGNASVLHLFFPAMVSVVYSLRWVHFHLKKVLFNIWMQGCPSAVPRSLNDLPSFSMRSNCRSVSTPNSIDPELLGKISLLAYLVIDLQGNSTALAPNFTRLNHPLIDSDLHSTIIQATVDLLNATTVSSLLASLDLTLGHSRTSLYLLDRCNCMHAPGLEEFYALLRAIFRTAADAQAWCHDHPVVPIKHHQGHSNVDGGDTPIVVGLSDLLSRLTLGLLGPIKLSVKVDGLGAGLSYDINNLLNGVGLGPQNAKRESVLNVDSFLSTNVLALGQLKVLINLVVHLQRSMTSLSSSESVSCLGLVQPTLMKEIVDGLTAITYSSTASASLSNLNRILAAEADLQKSLQKCRLDTAVEDLIDLLVNITETTLRFLEVCKTGLVTSSGTTFSHRPTMLPAISLNSSTTSSIITSSSTQPSPLPTALSVDIGSLANTHGSSSLNPTSSRTRSLTISRPTPSRTPLSNDEIVLALNHILSSLGLAEVKGVVTIGGLGPGLTESVNDLLDGLGIGRDDLHRRHKRQVAVDGANAHTNVITGQKLQKDGALIDLVIGFVDACGLLDCARIRPVRTLGVDFVGAILNAHVNILTSRSWTKFAEALDNLADLSSETVKFLEGHSWTTSGGLGMVYEYMLGILDVTFTLQDITQLMGVDNLRRLGMQDEKPVVVGMTKFLNELHAQGEVAVFGVGGVHVNGTASKSSNVLKVGLSDVRK